MNDEIFANEETARTASPCVTEIRNKLFALADPSYADFHSALMPTVTRERIIGVRTPLMRALAKELFGGSLATEFLNKLPHYYYEENNLHAFLIEKIADFDECKRKLDEFLPFVDNWATCDMTSVKCFKKNYEKAREAALEWLSSEHVYTVRFGIITFLKLFTDERFFHSDAERIVKIKSDEYYVNSAIAWYFATLATKRYEDALPYFKGDKLNAEVKNFAIKKVKESRTVPDERKAFLNGLRVKKG